MRRRTRQLGIAAAATAALALAGCGGGSDERGGTPPHGTTATTPAAPRRWSPPAMRIEPGHGREIGAEARLDYAASSATLPRGFVPGGIPVGTRAGECVVPEPTATVRAEIYATAQREMTSGVVAPIDDGHILLADCAGDGVWAFASWIQQRADGRTTTWIDELRADGGGHWTGTARNVQPGCRMPPAAAAAWQIDITACPPRPTPPPPTPTVPDPTPRIPPPGGEQPLAPGTSRA
jgi:hypothetical protein